MASRCPTSPVITMKRATDRCRSTPERGNRRPACTCFSQAGRPVPRVRKWFLTHARTPRRLDRLSERWSHGSQRKDDSLSNRNLTGPRRCLPVYGDPSYPAGLAGVAAARARQRSYGGSFSHSLLGRQRIRATRAPLDRVPTPPPSEGRRHPQDTESLRFLQRCQRDHTAVPSGPY